MVRHEDIQKSVGDAGKLLRKNRRGKIGKNGSGEKHWLFRRLLGRQMEGTQGTYYNKSLDEMPVVCENKVSIQAVIGKAVLDAVRGFAGGGKSDGEETPQAGWLPVYESEITGWDPALAGRDPIGGYACSKCGYEAVYSCNDEYVLSDYCPGCGARMAGGAE